MRVLHCISSVNPSGGGPIEGVTRLAVEMKRIGHSTEVVSLDDPGEPWVAGYPGVHALGPGMHRYGYSTRLVPWLRENASSYDVVIANGLWQYNAFAVWRALRGGATPYVVFPHGMLDPWFKRHYPLKHVKKWLYWPWADYRVLRDAKAVIFTSQQERVGARESFWLYRANETVVNYGTADPQPLRARDRESFISQFPELAGCRLLLFLGRINRKKGCDLLVRSFAEVASLDANLRLVMAGPDATDWAPELREMASTLGVANRITWTGELRGEAKWGAFQSAEAFVLCSHQENFGIAVAEALACGVPVLISDKVNIWREILADGAGLVAPDTAEGATHLLRGWLEMTDEARRTMRISSRNCFVRRFEISHTADSLVGILRERGIGE
jgi:glycosyltransferase involved in cell wall biosynthesis